MKQQTALEWFWNKIALKLSVQQINEFLPEFEQSKAMEKEQIMNAWEDGSETEYQYHVNGEFRRCSNDYYNETYGKQEKL